MSGISATAAPLFDVAVLSGGQLELLDDALNVLATLTVNAQLFTQLAAPIPGTVASGLVTRAGTPTRWRARTSLGLAVTGGIISEQTLKLDHASPLVFGVTVTATLWILSTSVSPASVGVSASSV
jgi:hypothetical protein